MKSHLLESHQTTPGKRFVRTPFPNIPLDVEILVSDEMRRNQQQVRAAAQMNHGAWAIEV